MSIQKSFFPLRAFFIFIKGARVKTLPAILTPLIMSGGYAFYQTGKFETGIFVFTVLSALFIQIAVNFFNDAGDSQQGIDSSLRKGPVRLVQSGSLSFSQTQLIGFACCALAVLCGIPLIWHGGWPIFVIGALSCLSAWLYTAGPFSLLKTGLSELFCFLFFGLFAVTGTYYLQTLHWSLPSLYLGIQCGLWAVSLLLINHLRDEREDLKGGRKHFVTLYGRIHSLLFLVLIQAVIYLLCFFWMGQGLKSGVWTFFLMPLSAMLLYFVCSSPPSEKYNFYLALCSGLYMLFGIFWTVGLF